MKQQLSSLEEIAFFSDGPASQFKQNYLIHNLTRMSYEYELILSWHYFATSHGSGVVDGIGGNIKCFVWRQTLTKKDKCEDAAGFVNTAKAETTAIIIDKITQQDIDKSTTKLQRYFFQIQALSTFKTNFSYREF